jgi:hypothetical protein
VPTPGVLSFDQAAPGTRAINNHANSFMRPPTAQQPSFVICSHVGQIFTLIETT